MRIATYNVEFLIDVGPHPHGKPGQLLSAEFVQSRVDYFADAFKKLNADVLLLQEVGSENLLKRILEKCGSTYKYFIGVPDKNGIGNAVVYKGDCTCESVPTNTNFPVFREGDTDTIGLHIDSRREFVVVTGTYGDKPFKLLNLHLKSSWPMPERNAAGIPNPMDSQLTRAEGYMRSDIFRLDQARKVRLIIDGFFKEDPNVQVLVAGDCNALFRESPVRIVQGPIRDGADSLVSVTETIPEDKRYSINSSGSGKNLIDHVFVSKNLKDAVRSVEIYNNTLFDHESSPLFPFIIESDHAPIVVELA